MKTDPNEACKNQREIFWWAFLHDVVAHPLMGLFGYAAWTLRFHDYTSRKAWPRCVTQLVIQPEDDAILPVLREFFLAQGKSVITRGVPTPTGYEYRVETHKNLSDVTQ